MSDARGTWLGRWWFAPAPAERLAMLRILIGAYALVYVALRVGELAALSRLPAAEYAPVGVARWLPGPLSPEVAVALGAVTVVALGTFTAGAWWRISGPLAAALLLLTTCYRNSWNMVFHTENLLVLHVIALAFTPAADAYAFGARARGRIPAAAGYGWGIRLLAALTAVTYVLASIAKLRLAGFHWIDGEFLRNQIAVDNLRKAVLGDRVAPLATPLLDHPAWFAVVSIATLVLELGAPVSLLGGRLARGWAVGAWGFHVGVVLMMNIWFPYPLLGFAYLPLLRVERVPRRVIEIIRGRRSPAPAAPAAPAAPGAHDRE